MQLGSQAQNGWRREKSELGSKQQRCNTILLSLASVSLSRKWTLHYIPNRVAKMMETDDV